LDEFTKRLLLGTAKSAGALAVLPEVDALLATIPTVSPEKSLLLTLGAAGVYERAGRKSQPTPQAASAREEHLPVCKPKFALLLRDMFAGEHSELLAEALALLTQSGGRLPPELLPAALSVRDAHVRTLLTAVLGERGRWLSGFNPDWSWASAEVLPESLPASADTAWLEGTLAERASLLRLARKLEPARARAWIEEVWKNEKADARQKLLETFEINLSPADEILLDGMLGDRSAGVRAIAAGLLVRLASSALAGRMRARAEQLLKFTTQEKPARGVKAALQAVLGGRSAGKLEIEPPADIDDDWEHDGIVAKPPQGVGARAWWLLQTVALVDPRHWEEKFAIPPAEIVSSAQEDEWFLSLADGWAQAAMRFNAPTWMTAVWDALHAAPPPRNAAREVQAVAKLLRELLGQMPADEAQTRVAQLFDQPPTEGVLTWLDAIGSLAPPWSAQFSQAYLRHVRRMIQTPQASRQYIYPIGVTLEAAARAIPAESLTAALLDWQIPDADDRAMREQFVDKFLETIRLRQALIEEAGV